MWPTLRVFWTDQNGTTAIEYAIIAGGVALAIVATVDALGVVVLSKYQSVRSSFG
jgi:pilus assembly protein Flp/PilA